MGSEDQPANNATEAENSRVRRARRRLKKKKANKRKRDNNPDDTPDTTTKENDTKNHLVKEEDADVGEVEIEWVSGETTTGSGAVAQVFEDVFSKFDTPEEVTNPSKRVVVEQGKGVEVAVGVQEEEEEEKPPIPSRKAIKRMNRLGIAALKQLVKRPDVVEVWDTTASDPRTLVYLKGYRNTVPVPQHWCQKRKYLQGKRGIEKLPFRLPTFIEDTGIASMRGVSAEAGGDPKTAKQKQRDRVAPKTGKIDINYQVLHDAFFRHQTKPPMTKHGELYYEGKEFEVSVASKRPGQLSDQLKIALGMMVAPNDSDKAVWQSHTTPPPYLHNMQRYGPPPSYPNLVIPGVNAPIPLGASYGTHQGGWGVPPSDQAGRALYGGNPFDPAGSVAMGADGEGNENDIDTSVRWGRVEGEDEIDSPERDDDDDNDNNDENQSQNKGELSGLRSVGVGEGIATPSLGMDSVSVGLKTPDAANLDLRKALRTGKETPMEVNPNPQLYQVVPEQQNAIGNAAFGSDKVYEVQSVSQLMGEKKKGADDRVNVSLNPDELENMDESILKQKYAEKLQEQGDDDDDEDLGKKKGQKHKGFKF